MTFTNKNSGVFSFLVSLFFISSLIESAETQIKTPEKAIVSMHNLIKNYPLTDSSQQTLYEKQHNNTVLLAGKTLYDQSQREILEALQEIDQRIAYWQYQKDHAWTYFFSKNPVKWVTGEKQNIEVENKLDILKSHQGELFVLLGQLSKLENEFNLGFKDIFLKNPTIGYEWIDTLLNSLTRIKTDTIVVAETTNPFVKRLSQLKLKLQKVSNFKEIVLSDIPETMIPSHIERNWLKYSALLLALRYGYSNIDTLSSLATDYITRTKTYLESAVQPVKELFFPSELNKELLIQQKNIDETMTTMKNLLNELEKAAIISEEEKNIIIIDALKGNSAEFQKLWDEKIANKFWNAKKYGLRALNILGQLVAFPSINRFEKSFSALLNLALLTPSFILGTLSYRGFSNVYKRLSTKDYRSLRQNLIAINSLFIDPTKPLTDEQYGQMMYLIYKTKQLAKTQLSRQRSLLEEFIADLERIESREYNIVAKRNIIEDMFKKYDFLGFIQQKSA